jgi:ElaB/YqjD/DUF883 family membrane-anchored ribosome-binding protein
MNNADIQEKTNDELRSLANRIANAIQGGKFTAAELQAAITKRSKKFARKADDLVHDFAWTAVGMGIGLGFLMGLAAGRATPAVPEIQPLREKPLRRPEDEKVAKGESDAWDKFQTILPLALFALKTFQELRGSRGHGRR